MLTKSKLILAALLTAGSLAVSAVPSGAMPRLSTDAATASNIEQIGWRCGPGAHINRFGHCVPNFRPMFRPHRHPQWHPRRRIIWHRND